MRVTSLSLLVLCLTMAAVPAMAQDIYDNGPINGNNNAWSINSGSVVSDTFFVDGNGHLTGIQFGAWMSRGDVLQSAEVSITSQEFGGTTFFDGLVNFTQSNCTGNQYGFDVCTETGTLNLALDFGSYWLNLQNATVANGDPVYWDENSGEGCFGDGCPSMASQSGAGTIPSEAFTILGQVETGPGTGQTPEPSSIMLFGSGILGLAGMLRRKLF